MAEWESNAHVWSSCTVVRQQSMCRLQKDHFSLCSLCTAWRPVTQFCVYSMCGCLYLASSKHSRQGKKYSVSVLLKKVRCMCPPLPSFLSLLCNGTVDGWHHYRSCLRQSKNMVQDSNSMWHLCNCREQERGLDHKLFLWQSRASVTVRAGEEERFILE